MVYGKETEMNIFDFLIWLNRETDYGDWHTNVKTEVENQLDKLNIFTDDEIKALWRILSHHYVSYEDAEALAVTRKISRIIDELAQ